MKKFKELFERHVLLLEQKWGSLTWEEQKRWILVGFCFYFLLTLTSILRGVSSIF